MESSVSTAILSNAFNLPAFRSTSYFKSHSKLAKRANCPLFIADEKIFGQKIVEGEVATWLKLPLVELLLRDFESVFYLDADCLVSEDCPSPNVILNLSPEKFFIVLGHSGRPNAGVFLARRGQRITGFCLDHMRDKPPHITEVWGENTHVIWACREFGFFGLPGTFNATSYPEAFIAHHTGPNFPLRTMEFEKPTGKNIIQFASFPDGESFRNFAFTATLTPEPI